MAEGRVLKDILWPAKPIQEGNADLEAVYLGIRALSAGRLEGSGPFPLREPPSL